MHNKTNDYREAILSVLNHYDSVWAHTGGLKNQIISDNQRNTFVMLIFGWQNTDTYTHLLCFHIEIIEGKVWIHENNTDTMIAVDLIEKGVSPDDIVLGFEKPYTPNKQLLTTPTLLKLP